jgi:hypothetical protein
MGSNLPAWRSAATLGILPRLGPPHNLYITPVLEMKPVLDDKPIIF